MFWYLVRRLAQAALVLWAAFTLAFLILFAMPSDPVRLVLNSGGAGNVAATVSPEQIAAINAQFGFDRPLIVQYFSALGNALHGDFGTSLQTRRPVVQEIASVLPSTLTLAALALIFAVLWGTVLAVLSTYTRMGWLRQLLLSLPAVGASVPAFWLGLLLIQVFSFQLGWFPPMGNKGWASLVMPVVTLSLPVGAAIAQVLARSLRTAMAEPYVVTARAKGASRMRVLLHHAIRNAAIPPLTMMGLLVGQLVASAVVTETVFSRTGLGRLTVSAVNRQDIPVVLGVVVLSAVLFVVTSLIVDLVYSVIDPRVNVRSLAAR
ncbi:peptide ABC transporter permease [Mycobacterium sp. MS1601]|uniref:ABC transporter permease n=1 Tax=Mycobacterium sp. MS1601 TaxID=1936029 RepID=UPI0009792E4A|nr:ABC transporter permease [Mycobacterium sp. MS1601]AQA01365.1 peptide ABC transporter permease [Mycobacterium sp. MS1601]